MTVVADTSGNTPNHTSVRREQLYVYDPIGMCYPAIDSCIVQDFVMIAWRDHNGKFHEWVAPENEVTYDDQPGEGVLLHHSLMDDIVLSAVARNNFEFAA